MYINDTLVIIPAYNEEKNIGAVLRGLQATKIPADILVVNDGSSDKTALVAQENGATIISLITNLGYGGAMQTGFKYAVEKGYKYVVQFDADGQHDPLDAVNILQELKTGGYDIVIGSRFLGQGTLRPGMIKKTAIRIFSFMIKLSTGDKILDPTSGLQGLSRAVFSYYSCTGNYPEDYPDADTLIGSILKGYKLLEIPANMKDRVSGVSMHTGLKTLFYPIKMLVSILVVITRARLRREGDIL